MKAIVARKYATNIEDYQVSDWISRRKQVIGIFNRILPFLIGG
jgi:hypothetical protein